MIVVEDLCVRAGEFCLSHVSFEVPGGKYAVLMGRTGTGKTTLLESICGLRQVDGGRIRLMDRDVTQLKPAERGVGLVPQDGALFQTMSIREHLAFALRVRRWRRAAIDSRVAELAEMLGIAHLLERSPLGLSGGERQRVALGRALAAHPGVLCLDEPLSALDDATREEMHALLETIRARTGVTTLHITHNRADAERLGDVFLRLDAGQVHVIDRGSGFPA